jgi:hypothetical protein
MSLDARESAKPCLVRRRSFMAAYSAPPEPDGAAGGLIPPSSC